MVEGARSPKARDCAAHRVCGSRGRNELQCYEEGTAGSNFVRQKFLLIAVKYVY